MDRDDSNSPFLRLAQFKDLSALQTLIPQSVSALSQAYYTSAQIQSANRHVFGIDTQLIKDQTYFVVETAQIIIAGGGWSKRLTLYGGDQMKTEVDPLLDPTIHPARIRAFFVHPQYARRGLATLILNACLEAARQNHFSHAELAATLPGEPFYARHGFAVIERVPTLLPDGVPIEFVRMGRAL